MQKQLHVLVEGRVQGVGFRYFVEMKANALDLTGWVRNLYSGEVETVAEGEEEALVQFLAYLNHGPSPANVSHVSAEWSDATGSFPTFQIRSSWISE